MDHKTEQDAGLLEQAASMLEGLANDERNRGNCSAAEGAACSAHAIRRLAPAMLRAGRGCLAQIEEPAQPVSPQGVPAGEIVLFGGDLKEVSWTGGKMPLPGTKLYAGAAPAAVTGPALGTKFFSASNEGLDEHDTAEAAQSEAQSIIDMYREEAADGWPEEVDSVCWGMILGKAVERPVKDAPFMGGIAGSDMEPVDYVLEPVAAPALEAPAAPAVPAGFALVPIEPTQQMLDAGRWSGAGSVSSQEVWDRMLATVTPPPAAYADDLVALVTELVQALRQAAPDNDLAGHALDYLKRNGLQGSPLLAAPAAPEDPMDWPLPCDVTVGHGTIRKGCKLRTLVLRMQVLYNLAQETELAAPAAPAVDESFEQRMSDWAHGDALDAERYRDLSQAARDVLAERRRQVNAEGFSPERDDQYVGGQLAGAATSYLILAAGGREDEARAFWPWRQEWLKPGSQRRYLEKACALGLAEMERQDRAAAQAAAKGAA